MPQLFEYQHEYKLVGSASDASDDYEANLRTPQERKLIDTLVASTLAFVAAATWSLYLLVAVIAKPHPLSTASPSFYVNNGAVHNTFVQVSTVESRPYKEHWPNSKFPKWALKKTYFNVSSHEQICFAHVGKGGGSTIGCSLGFSLHCHHDDGSGEQMTIPPSGLLAKLTSHTFHKDVYDCHDDSGYFLFIIRDPIDRVRSAFNYERPSRGSRDRRTAFYYKCPFYHLEEFVQNGLGEGNITEVGMEKCKKWAFKAIRGRDGTYNSPSHWYYNYQYYYEAIPSDSNILVIRNDHMEEDIRGIEDGFGCRENERLKITKAMNKNTWSHKKDLYLSDESISILCHTMCNEIQVYKKILRRALNMQEDIIRMSLLDLKSKCPKEVIAEECSDAMPDISKKLSSKRGY